MAVFFDGEEIPASLVRTIIGKSLSRIGIYHGTTHKFQAPTFQPPFDILRGEAAEFFDYDDDWINRMIRHVLSTVGTEANSEIQQKLDLAGKDSGIPLLAHITFDEKENRTTELIYLGRQRFYVLATNRSTLMPGNIIKARKYPLNNNTVWDFDIYENFDAKKPYVPEVYSKSQAWFQTSNVTAIKINNSPELLSIIDADNRYGGEFVKLSSDADIALESILKTVCDAVANLPGGLNSNEMFPGYMDMLHEAKASGISTYLLNILIEYIERRVQQEYVFINSDWHEYKTDEKIEEERKEQERKDREEFNKLNAKLNAELKKIRMRRIFFVFYAPGKITSESQNYLNHISEGLEKLADKGFGVKGYAKASIVEALDKTKPPRWHNVVVSLIIAGVLIVGSFVAYSWVIAQKSMAQFNNNLETMMTMVENEQFNEAKEFVQISYEAFRPGYLRFLVGRKTRQADAYIETHIDNFVEERLAMIQTMIKANRNRIDDYTWKLIVEAMEFRPDNETLNELRQKYITQ